MNSLPEAISFGAPCCLNTRRLSAHSSDPPPVAEYEAALRPFICYGINCGQRAFHVPRKLPATQGGSPQAIGSTPASRRGEDL